MQTKIQPVQVFPHWANTLSITGAGITKLGNDGQAQIGWALLTEEDKAVAGGSVELTTAEYNAWGTDDECLFEIVLSKLGLSRAN